MLVWIINCTKNARYVHKKCTVRTQKMHGTYTKNLCSCSRNQKSPTSTGNTNDNHVHKVFPD